MAIMAVPLLKTRLTFEDARHISLDGELEEGEWIPVTRPTLWHGQVMAQVAFLLKIFLRDHPIGQVACGDPGVEVSHDPDTLRGPDVVFGADEHLVEGRMPDDWLETPPDLVVENVSKSQTVAAVAPRARAYLAAGARLAWVVDPKPERVLVFAPLAGVRTLYRDDQLHGGDVLPGFHCIVADLFR